MKKEVIVSDTKKPAIAGFVVEVVGDARFELATPWTQTKCATKLR